MTLEQIQAQMMNMQVAIDTLTTQLRQSQALEQNLIAEDKPA